MSTQQLSASFVHSPYNYEGMPDLKANVEDVIAAPALTNAEESPKSAPSAEAVRLSAFFAFNPTQRFLNCHTFPLNGISVPVAPASIEAVTTPAPATPCVEATQPAAASLPPFGKRRFGASPSTSSLSSVSSCATTLSTCSSTNSILSTCSSTSSACCCHETTATNAPQQQAEEADEAEEDDTKPRCKHFSAWKCRRVKLGIRHMICRRCLARWRQLPPNGFVPHSARVSPLAPTSPVPAAVAAPALCCMPPPALMMPPVAFPFMMMPPAIHAIQSCQ